MIERFSEDIDLILDWRIVTNEDPMAARSNARQSRLNARLNESAKAYIASDLLILLKNALGEHCSLEVNPEERDLGHIVRVQYPKTSNGDNVLPYIQLEIGPLASWLPHSQYSVRSYVAEEFPDQFDDPDCPVRAIDAQRTFWEKATILHHEANRPESSIVPLRYSRHYYDLYLMSKNQVKADALQDQLLFQSVVTFKKKFYPRGWARYDEAKPGTFKLIPPDCIQHVMRQDYEAMQEMIFGHRPSFDEILNGLSALEDEINALSPTKEV